MKPRTHNRLDKPRSFKKNKDFSKPTFFKAVCDQCGANCEIPFKPTQGKPVLCSNCFEHKPRDNSGERRTSNRETSKYQAICDSCGNECEVPFKPTKGKPIFCDACFESKKVNEMDELKMEIAILNTKVDKVLEILKTLFAVKKYKSEIKEELEIPKKRKVVVNRDDEDEESDDI
ncbi:MAG: hypothetical protein JXR70_02480 [Spirochaetales bacterium]|nr:hypothetical protein [Spirochaetales bacterium]